ncbi:hypothetical protein [Propionicicella superfundia]|uniref:hypothetical protein n=1 Tax=Propionicicella superfundia TaxID=348582 RepID=UPI0004250BDE|nr:hypothetical protein [Propionicicella superfundia]
MAGSDPAGWAAAADLARLTFTAPAASGARGAHLPVPACRGLHSYLPDGTQACWRHGLDGTFAVDVERRAVPPPHLAARWHGPAEEFWEAWVTAEVVAKLTRTPVLTLAARGLPVPVPSAVDALVVREGDLVACFGRLRGVVP